MPRKKQPPRWRKWIQLAINIALFLVALGVLRHILTEYKVADIVKSLHRIGPGYIAASLGLTILGYAALVGYDYLSLFVAEHPIPLARMWRASFVSHAVQNSAPVAILAGGGVRYRLFSKLGVSGEETAAVVAGNLLTFIIGLFAVAGLSFAIAPVPIPDKFHLPIHSLQPVGFAFLALVVAALVYSERGKGHIKLWRWNLDLPEGSLVREQLGVSVADWLLSSTALYVLMIAAGPVPFLKFLSGFLLAQIVTQVIPLPGGVGVFEAAVLLLRPRELDAALATAALLMYRVLYYLIPLFVATALLAHEASGKPRRQASKANRITRDVAPHLLAVLCFITGAAMLALDAIPAKAAQFKWLGHLLQVVVMEGSHFITSLIGVGLLLLAYGLERRLRSAFRLTLLLLFLAIPTVIIRAMDMVSAAVLIVLFLLLLTARREFTRRIPFSAEPVNAGWLAAALAAVGGVVWLGVYLQIQGHYTPDLWWKFTLDEDAPRVLRIVLAVLLGLITFVGARLITRAHRYRVRRRA